MQVCISAVQEDSIFTEFLEYDWPRFIGNLKQHEDDLLQLTPIFTRKKPENQDENNKRIHLLLSLVQAQSQQNLITHSINSTLLSSINVWMLSVEQVETLANALINTWNQLKNKYTPPIADLLSTLMRSIALSDLYSQYTQASFIKGAVQLMLKSLYGKRVILLESAQPSIRQLMSLITIRELKQSSIADLNRVLPDLFQQITTCSSSGYPGVFAQISGQNSSYSKCDSSIEDIKILMNDLRDHSPFTSP